jgi:hypothetical protein
MRFARLSSLLIILFAALVTGCGGNQIAADEVTVDPPTLTIPSDPESAPGATTADADDENAEEDADGDEPEETPTPDPATGGTTPGTTGTGGTGGSAATPAPTPEATATAAPPEDTGGATADEGLDQFCADNPGAC